MALAVLLMLTASGCSKPPQTPPSMLLPRYGADDAALLDDGFSGHLFRSAFVSGRPGDEPRFDDRVRAAESIWLLKVATMSREGSMGTSRRYSLSFRTLETLAGPPPTEPVELAISGKDPAFQWIDRVGGTWVGSELLLMVRRYRGRTHPSVHFHGEPNLPELRARILAVRAAQAASEPAKPDNK